MGSMTGVTAVEVNQFVRSPLVIGPSTNRGVALPSLRGQGTKVRSRSTLVVYSHDPRPWSTPSPPGRLRTQRRRIAPA